MKDHLTPKAALADVLLAPVGGVKRFIVLRRLRLRPMPWEAIAVEIGEATGGRVQVTGASVQAWVRDSDFPIPGTDSAVAS